MSNKKVFKIAAAQEPLEFEIDGDTFTAIAPNRLPGNVLIEYVENIQLGRVYQGHKTFFTKALLPESGERFEDRLNNPDNPISLEVMIEVAEWLTSSYSNFTVGGSK